VIPSEDVVIFPLPTAQNNPSSGDQQTVCHVPKSDEHVLSTQSIPLLEVMTILDDVADTQNNFNSGDQHTVNQFLDVAVCVSQDIPSEDVITTLPPTAQNNPNSGDQHTDDHMAVFELVCKDQLVPSGDVITLLVVPGDATAQNNPNSGDQHTDDQ
jgi:hypothetical protein